MELYSSLGDKISRWIGERVRGAGMTGVVVGLSGGIDSGVSAALCRNALGRENVLGLVMPCRSLEADTADGLRTAEFLGIRALRIDLSGVLHLFIKDGGIDPDNRLNVANVKARLRMTMEYAHSEGRLVVGTGNLSETMTGYSTKWGDGAADIFPIAELWKDEVRSLALSMGLPEWITERVPSAGLWEGQTDEGEMGVTYEEIKKYHTEGPGTVSEAAASRIGQLFLSSSHKREPVPSFHARGFLDGR
jgi:NAD+ synthase